MNITRLAVNPFVELTYILWTCEGGEAAIVDPGMMTEAERQLVTGFIDEHRLTVTHVLLTHLHIDHAASAQWTADRYGVAVEGGQADSPLGQGLPEQAAHFRLQVAVPPLTPGHPLADGDEFTLGDEPVQVLAVPGHSPGSLAYYLPESHLVLAGDTLFAGSIGRTDLPGGNHEVLLAAIAGKLLALPDHTTVYPGHGPETTIGDERRDNPFLIGL